jgi:hypothetical protein
VNQHDRADLTRRLTEAAERMDFLLSCVCGLSDRERKSMTYYALATHALDHVDTFPLLVLKGPMGTGKSKALRVAGALAYRPNAFSLRGRTLPAIRDALKASHNGTAIIEEADYAWKDSEMFERLLSDRYQRASAEAALKQPAGGLPGRFVTVTKQYFGATLLHRRLPFVDAALNGRSVFVRFRASHDRTYYEFRDDDDGMVETRELVQGLTFELPEVAQPPGVASRVFDTYKPLLGAAQMCGDEGFPNMILPKLQAETLALKEAQSIEPDALVLRALIDCLYSGERLDLRYVPLSELGDSIWKNQRVSMRPQQIGALARELGFQTKNSHGVTKVVPTPATLLRACTECGYEDEAIAELRAHVTAEGKAKKAKPGKR